MEEQSKDPKNRKDGKKTEVRCEKNHIQSKRKDFGKLKPLKPTGLQYLKFRDTAQVAFLGRPLFWPMVSLGDFRTESLGFLPSKNR